MTDLDRIAAEFVAKVNGWSIYGTDEFHINSSVPGVVIRPYRVELWSGENKFQVWHPSTDANQLRVVKEAIVKYRLNWILELNYYPDEERGLMVHLLYYRWIQKVGTEDEGFDLKAYGEYAEHDAILECVRQISEATHD